MTIVSRIARTIRPLRDADVAHDRPGLPALPPKRSVGPLLRDDLDRADQVRASAPRRPADGRRGAAALGARYGPRSSATRSTSFSRSMISMFCSATAQRDRMARIGVAVDEIVVALAQRLDDRAADRRGRDRQIARGQALRHRHDVGREAEMLEAEPAAQPAEAADHFVDTSRMPYLRQIASTRGQ